MRVGGCLFGVCDEFGHPNSQLQLTDLKLSPVEGSAGPKVKLLQRAVESPKIGGLRGLSIEPAGDAGCQIGLLFGPHRGVALRPQRAEVLVK
jgi:hypothetical protein